MLQKKRHRRLNIWSPAPFLVQAVGLTSVRRTYIISKVPRPRGLCPLVDGKVPCGNGTAVSKGIVGLSLRFSELGSQFSAGPLHEGVPLATTLQNARFNATGPIGDFMGGHVGQHHVVQGLGVSARPRR